MKVFACLAYRTSRKIVSLFTLCVVLAVLALPALAQPELSYSQYQAMAWAANRIDHLAKFEPLDGEPGMYLAMGERFGAVHVARISPNGAERVWKSIQLSGIPEEVIVADLDGDGLDDSLLCRTDGGKIYVWNLDGYNLVWESLQAEFQTIRCFTVANMDDDQENEIVLNADNKIIYISGSSFNRDFTSINDYEASMIRCGDVDGDGRIEVVLNSGQVLDSVSGDVEWEDQAFFGRIELLDIDGDGIPEVLTENEGGGPMKVFDVDYRTEVRFQ